MRQCDINLRHQIIAVNRRHRKNKWRRREIPIADSHCIWALERLMDRSCELAGRSPEMHLFPARVTRNNFDGSRHMSETGIRKQFEAVRKATVLRGMHRTLKNHMIQGFVIERHGRLANR